MWEFLSGIWGGISSTVGEVYDDVAGSYVGQKIGDAYDYVTGNESYGTFKDSDFDNFNYSSSKSSALGAAMEFAGGFMEVVAPAGGSPTQMPSSKRRRVSAPSSRASAGSFNVSKSNLANLEFGYTPRVNDAIIKANTSKNPSIEMAIAQMMNYRSSGGATIKLQGARPPSVTARTKKPSFAPKYYG